MDAPRANSEKPKEYGKLSLTVSWNKCNIMFLFWLRFILLPLSRKIISQNFFHSPGSNNSLRSSCAPCTTALILRVGQFHCLGLSPINSLWRRWYQQNTNWHVAFVWGMEEEGNGKKKKKKIPILSKNKSCQRDKCSEECTDFFFFLFFFWLVLSNTESWEVPCPLLQTKL